MNNQDWLTIQVFELIIGQAETHIKYHTAVQALVNATKEAIGPEFKEIYERHLHEMEANSPFAEGAEHARSLREQLEKLKRADSRPPAQPD